MPQNDTETDPAQITFTGKGCNIHHSNFAPGLVTIVDLGVDPVRKVEVPMGDIMNFAAEAVRQARIDQLGTLNTNELLLGRGDIARG